MYGITYDIKSTAPKAKVRERDRKSKWMTKRKWHLAQRRRSNSTLGFLFSVLPSHRHRPPTSFSFSFIFSCDIRRPCTTLAIRHERERGRRTRPARGLWSRDDCNLHKLSFRFDDDIVEATAVKKWIENDWRIEFFALRTLDRHDTTSRVFNKKDEEPFCIFYLHLDYLRDKGNQSEIKVRSNINTSKVLEI